MADVNYENNNKVVITVEEWADLSPAQAKRIYQYCEWVSQTITLFVKKNRQYGDAISIGGVRGAIYELSGIYARLWNMVVMNDPTGEENLETISDILMDAVNYAFICLFLADERNWKGKFGDME